MSNLWKLIGMSAAPFVAYKLHGKGMWVAVLGGAAVGWAINEYVLPSVMTAVDSAASQ